MVLETVAPDLENITTFVSMFFLDYVRFQVVSEFPSNHLKICGL
jgi:hypothetical protein